MICAVHPGKWPGRHYWFNEHFPTITSKRRNRIKKDLFDIDWRKKLKKIFSWRLAQLLVSSSSSESCRCQQVEIYTWNRTSFRLRISNGTSRVFCKICVFVCFVLASSCCEYLEMKQLIVKIQKVRGLLHNQLHPHSPAMITPKHNKNKKEVEDEVEKLCKRSVWPKTVLSSKISLYFLKRNVFSSSAPERCSYIKIHGHLNSKTLQFASWIRRRPTKYGVVSWY